MKIQSILSLQSHPSFPSISTKFCTAKISKKYPYSDTTSTSGDFSIQRKLDWQFKFPSKFQNLVAAVFIFTEHRASALNPWRVDLRGFLSPTSAYSGASYDTSWAALLSLYTKASIAGYGKIISNNVSFEFSWGSHFVGFLKVLVHHRRMRRGGAEGHCALTIFCKTKNSGAICRSIWVKCS